MTQVAEMESDNELLKSEVREYWDAHPCGTQFTELEWGSKEFFDQVEKTRYEIQPFMQRLVGFDRYRGKKVLEIGCGLGTDLLQFARHGAIVTGVDLTPKSIELVRQRFSLEELPVDAQVADAEQLPFGDNTFDVAYSFGVLHHTPDTQKAISEVYRVLKPGGRIIIMLYHKHSLHVWLGAVLHGIVTRQRGTTAAGDWVRIYDGPDNPLGKAYSKPEARRMFSGFWDLELSLLDPIRRRFPSFLNSINQAFLAPFLGFWLLITGVKPYRIS